MPPSLGSLFRSLDRTCGLAAVYTPKSGADPVEVLIVPGRSSQDAALNSVVRVGRR